MDPSPEEISALADQLSQLGKDMAATKDPVSRKVQVQNLCLEAQKMIRAIQDPVQGMMDTVTTTFAVSAVLALMELNIFDNVPASGTATVSELAQKANCEEEVITRLMRQLTCAGIFDEPSLGTFSHNRSSLPISTHYGPNGNYFYRVAFGEMLPSILSLNQYIQTQGANTMLTTYTSTPHSYHNNMLGSNFWQVLSSTPSRIETFSRGLSMFAALNPVVALFPFSTALTHNNSASRVLAVDIGGGRGEAMHELRKACPHLQGEMILQDRAEVLDNISEADLPSATVTKMAHDFFTPQPVQGAQVYYIRRVLHDWNDVDCARILSAIKPAMASDSRILVSDMCLPEPSTVKEAGAIWMDVMMLAIGGKERSERDWIALGKRCGLVLRRVWTERERWGALGLVEFALEENTLPALDGAQSAVVDSRNRTTGTEVMGDGAAGGVGNGTASAGTPGASAVRDEDWEERTVVGDREQSLDPGAAHE